MGSKDDMRILAVPRSVLFAEGGFEGFRPAAGFDYEAHALRNLQVVRRGDAEKDESFKQIIGYTLIVHPASKRVFAYRRSSGGGESRLHGKWSWGVGGHIEPDDHKDGNPIRTSVAREVGEEVTLTPVGEPKVLGYINFEGDAVSRVHFGILYALEAQGDVAPNDAEIAEGGLKPVAELERLLTEADVTVEDWSRLALPAVKAFLRA